MTVYTPVYNGAGSGVVTTSGTRVQVSTTSIPCKRVRITASNENGNLTPVDGDSAVVVVVGGATVVAAVSTRNGAPLYPAQSDWFTIADVSLLYIDANANSSKFWFYYEQY